MSEDLEELLELAKLTDEEKQQLVKDYQTATANTAVIDKFNPLEVRGPSPELIEKFQARIAEIFTDNAPYSFVPYWVLEVEYDKIHHATDEYATALRNWEIRRFVRIHLSMHSKVWRDRAKSNGHWIRLYEPTPWGKNYLTGWTSGYCKLTATEIDATKEVWPEGSHKNRRGKRRLVRAELNAQAK